MFIKLPGIHLQGCDLKAAIIHLKLRFPFIFHNKRLVFINILYIYTTIIAPDFHA